nr:DoxX family protein [Streptomyces sp. A2-16]
MGRRLQPRRLQAIGALELLSTTGLVLPALPDIAPVLVPLAATRPESPFGGAVITRLRHGENLTIVGALVHLTPGRLRGVGPLRPRVLHRPTTQLREPVAEGARAQPDVRALERLRHSIRASHDPQIDLTPVAQDRVAAVDTGQGVD